MLCRITPGTRLGALVSTGIGKHANTELPVASGQSSYHQVEPKGHWGHLCRGNELFRQSSAHTHFPREETAALIIHVNKARLFSSPTPSPGSHSGPRDGWMGLCSKMVTQIWEAGSQKEFRFASLSPTSNVFHWKGASGCVPLPHSH